MPAAIATRLRLDPCPASERVSEYDTDDCPEGYEASVQRATEGYNHGEDGIIRQKCGGGRRIIKKKIGN